MLSTNDKQKVRMQIAGEDRTLRKKEEQRGRGKVYLLKCW